MSYNLKVFSQKLRTIRKSLMLHKDYIADKTGISIKTIVRLENGKCLPNLDTLELLSPLYKTDLVRLLVECQFNDYYTFTSITNEIENKIDNGEFDKLESSLKLLEKFSYSISNEYYKGFILQQILFIDGILQYSRNEYNLALDTYTKALKITEPDFTLDKYSDFVLSDTEVRILMNIGFTLDKLKETKNSLDIMLFCKDSLDETAAIYPKICHNIAVIYSKMEIFSKSLAYYNEGITACRKSRQPLGLGLLYYGKGYSEYKLGNDNYLDSFKTAITLCNAFEQDKLKETIISKCMEHYNIKLE
ncbi:MAG: helix-turn-helix domain-containing protein [Catonella sp.]|uniref:helix-turn-helix domain-containing protein n=1 Tax=Catonella sp. TaxID=2382125 RepID=UPI003FA07562